MVVVVLAVEPEAVVALGAAVALFALPVDWHRGEFTMTWRRAAAMEWIVLTVALVLLGQIAG